MYSIPEMTHPLSKGWDQPSTKLIEFTKDSAVMSKRTLDSLLEYSNTNPSGVYAGKMWKLAQLIRLKNSLRVRRRWYLCWYEDSKEPGYCTTVRVRVRIKRGAG